GDLTFFNWTILGNQCGLVLGDIAHGVVMQAIEPTGIQAGTYAIANSAPPSVGLSYTETNLVVDPSQRFLHFWSATSGTLTIEDAGGGAFHFHATAPMAPDGLLGGGATGTFTLELDGTLDQIGL